MKRLIFILLVIITIPVVASKKAILIGVSNYPDGSGWCKLSSNNDVRLIKDILSPEWNLVVLEDENATYMAIKETLIHVADISSPGDTVYIHFSGHGQQMLPITNNPSNEADLLDEALVPYDAQLKWSPEYNGQNHLRDDEFGKLIDKIRDRLGKNGLVIVVLDACHSDSMQKGYSGEDDTSQIYRGTSDIFGENVTEAHLKKRYNRDTSIIPINNNSNVIYISACQAHSKNAEITNGGIGYGSLSYAVSVAIKGGEIEDVSLFLDRVVLSMDTLVPYQIPAIRASFNYNMPVLRQQMVSIPDTIKLNDTHVNYRYILIITISIILILIAIVWRLKKK